MLRYLPERESAADAGMVSQGDSARRGEFEVWVVLLTVLAVLIANRYLGSTTKIGWLPGALDDVGLDGASRWADGFIASARHRQFNQRVYFAVFRIVIYSVPAAIVARRVLGVRLRDLGCSFRGGWAHLRTYVGLYALLLPLIVWASTLSSFKAQYPFYEPNAWESFWPWFVVWEGLYLLHFIALEFFFRGFALHALSKHFGTLAIAVMVVPYTMIHFAKPFPEAVGSIAAGAVLGIVSLRSNSAGLGGVLHFAVALTLDGLTY